MQVGGNSFAGFGTEFITVNPYFGTDGVKPFVDVCNQEDRGLFILVKTSNPSSGEFQDQLVVSPPHAGSADGVVSPPHVSSADGVNERPLYELVADKVVELSLIHI